MPSTRLFDLIGADLIALNVLRLPCLGAHQCGTFHHIYFQPSIVHDPVGIKQVWKLPKLAPVWQKTRGSTLEDITLAPSIHAGACGHFSIIDGDIVPK